ncbi:polynucleotide 3'-phosphatase ZDP isoform X1 [Arabidopsis lyrata subsp. lyrata]|uniref:polynucleotide 3'-phosphatase ZDP isoform X1 n=1 Tax=Arabidopsis lyrata subsp. lyrata TaxID=81972 RepID=UPI000A29CF06|nr:polynucleotide 3'-phosphatase ZDP isoform X1 [Arabidopsis lyrata subsp. lyrata]|eukprot:XP_020888797.1 polynucleotide 3'-phosphatase ZDP isoform X1 [Arabidopsis lyrata subsp. lyrata]
MITVVPFVSLRFLFPLLINRSTLFFREQPQYLLYNHSYILRTTMPVVAEYAKSNRSSCKSCSKKIAVKSLRLGLISKGPGGVDMTRWHHFDCFPTDSESIASVDDIQGLSVLEKEDQDALTKLVEQGGQEPAKKLKQRDEKKEKVKKPLVGPKRFNEATTSKVIADYAKSSRSSCKRCSQTIVSKDLRVGLVTRDARGFDVTSWHHLGCFPIDWHPIDSVEDVGGYSSLEKGDQKELQQLAELSGKDTLIDDVQKMDEGDDESVADNELTEETKKGKHSQVAKLVEQPGEPAKEVNEDEEIKMPASDEISGQKIKETTGSPDSSKVISEYAKSSRSTCKKCSQTIAAKELRLGLVTRNFRGFDMTQWHHVGCFPVDSDPISSVEDVGGFSELQSGDQDALKELVQQCGKKTLVDKMDEDNDESEAKNKLTEETNKRKHSEVGEIVEKDESLTKANQHKAKTHKVNISESTSQVEVEAEISLSASDVKDKYRDANLLPKWKAFETVIFLERDDGLNDSEKIAAFDFDGCLAKTSVKIVGADAWSLMYPSIPEKLQSLYNQGYKLVIFTNESNIDRWKNKRQAAVDSKIGRLNSFIERVKVPIQVFIACGVSSSGGKGSKDDFYRKPKAGMWQLMKKHFNSGIAIDMDKSFYVGDAAGRKMDHSDADIKFAQASGLKFYTPEEYFIPASTSAGT